MKAETAEHLAQHDTMQEISDLITNLFSLIIEIIDKLLYKTQFALSKN